MTTNTTNTPTAVTAALPRLDVPADLGFTDAHELVRQTARRVLADTCPISLVRAIADAEADASEHDAAAGDAQSGAGDAARDAAARAEAARDGLWRELGQLGWPGIAIAEDAGGSGLDLLALALVLEECGRALVPAPLYSTALAALAIERMGAADHARRWLPRLCAGEAIGAVAFTEPGGGWDGIAATARPAEFAAHDARGGADHATGAVDHYVLTGAKTHVAWGQSADVVIAPFAAGDEVAVFALDRGAARSAGERSVDPTRPMARLVFAGDDPAGAVPGAARLPGGDAAGWRDLAVVAAAMLAAEMVGAAEAILCRTRDYAIERVQFDRPIGAFQAVKHPLVDVMLAVERARSLAYGAAAALSADVRVSDSARALTHMAKAAATEALAFAADRGVQLHGGFGFTWDCDAHLYMKRALWSGATLGDAGYHRRALADILLAND